jgi:tRNA (guanine37-N1)-methyltransferase
MRGVDILGNIAIVKFDRKVRQREKKKVALNFLKKNKSVRTILEKTGKFSGRLRTLKTKYLAGEKTKEALYKENGCVFRLNVESCYFSPRLSSERKEIAGKVKKGESVLVMFGGVAPYAIVIAKNSKAKKVVSVELGRECNKYAKENVKRNKLGNIIIKNGDVRKVFKDKNEKYDRIVMPRPNLKDSFLDVAFGKIAKGGVIHYYGFSEEKKKNQMLDEIERDAKKSGRRIKILKVKEAGNIAPYKFRYRVDLRVLN